MKVLFGLVTPLALASGMALGACPSGGETVLSCTMRDGSRVLDVCIIGQQVTYAYGKPGATPELSLSEPVREVEHVPWHGVGRSIWETTTFRNAGHAYEVYISVDRMDEDHPTQSGLTVYKGETEIAQILCDTGSDTIGIWAVTDAKATQGQCWQTESRDWGKCP